MCTVKETCWKCGKVEEVRYNPYYCHFCKQEKSALCMNSNCDFQEYICQECEEEEYENSHLQRAANMLDDSIYNEE